MKIISELNADLIIELLSGPDTIDRRPIVSEIIVKAKMPEVISALEKAIIPKIKSILCDILGERKDPSAITILLQTLDDYDPAVRASAADALAKVGTIDIGSSLLKHFVREVDDGVCQMLAIALGAVGYRPAALVLVKALSAKSGMLRGSAAWSLGKLEINEAKLALEKALLIENNKYAIARMTQSLEQIKSKN